MILCRKDRNRLFTTVFATSKIGSSVLQFVLQFQLLGHNSTNNLSDDAVINIKVHCIFVRCNILIHKFHIVQN